MLLSKINRGAAQWYCKKKKTKKKSKYAIKEKLHPVAISYKATWSRKVGLNPISRIHIRRISYLLIPKGENPRIFQATIIRFALGD